ncbi:hypothetical protein BJ912DRAFT_936871 [Pholiota molesta]|nr:hypothetical protein BJ912DRAFT_936871 [Pholiota molesta]
MHDINRHWWANTPSPSLSEATAPPLPSYEVPEDDYSIITIFIEDYQIIDGQMISLREDNHPPRDMLFDEKTPARGHHKEIFMMQGPSPTDTLERIYATKSFVFRGPNWYLPAPSAELAVWLEGARLTKCHLLCAPFQELLTAQGIRFYLFWSQAFDVLPTSLLCFHRSQRTSRLVQPWASGTIFRSKYPTTDQAALCDVLRASVMLDFEGFLTKNDTLLIFDCTTHTHDWEEDNVRYYLKNVGPTEDLRTDAVFVLLLVVTRIHPCTRRNTHGNDNLASNYHQPPSVHDSHVDNDRALPLPSTLRPTRRHCCVFDAAGGVVESWETVSTALAHHQPPPSHSNDAVRILQTPTAIVCPQHQHTHRRWSRQAHYLPRAGAKPSTTAPNRRRPAKRRGRRWESPTHRAQRRGRLSSILADSINVECAWKAHVAGVDDVNDEKTSGAQRRAAGRMTLEGTGTMSLEGRTSGAQRRAAGRMSLEGSFDECSLACTSHRLRLESSRSSSKAGRIAEGDGEQRVKPRRGSVVLNGVVGLRSCEPC